MLWQANENFNLTSNAYFQCLNTFLGLIKCYTNRFVTRFWGDDGGAVVFLVSTTILNDSR